jgi:hypothetical protein
MGSGQCRMQATPSSNLAAKRIQVSETRSSGNPTDGAVASRRGVDGTAILTGVRFPLFGWLRRNQPGILQEGAKDAEIKPEVTVSSALSASSCKRIGRSNLWGQASAGCRRRHRPTLQRSVFMFPRHALRAIQLTAPSLPAEASMAPQSSPVFDSRSWVGCGEINQAFYRRARRAQRSNRR